MYFAEFCVIVITRYSPDTKAKAVSIGIYGQFFEYCVHTWILWCAELQAQLPLLFLRSYLKLIVGRMEICQLLHLKHYFL